MGSYQKYKAEKDPGSDIDYGRNWGDSADGDKGWLHPDEIVVTSTWEITSDKEKVSTLIESDKGTGISTDGKITSIFLKGGTPGIMYKLTNKIVTYDINGTSRIEKKTGLIYCCKK